MEKYKKIALGLSIALHSTIFFSFYIPYKKLIKNKDIYYEENKKRSGIEKKVEIIEIKIPLQSSEKDFLIIKPKNIY